MSRYHIEVKGFVALSPKSLAKVFAWSEKNQRGVPLAGVYYDVCTAIGEFDFMTVADRLEAAWPEKDKSPGWGGYAEEALKVKDALYLCRDTIGRTILEMLKREERATSRKPA